ncbi:MAG: cell wall-binding repeat-containing protein [Clostridia bacterium]
MKGFKNSIINKMLSVSLSSSIVFMNIPINISYAQDNNEQINLLSDIKVGTKLPKITKVIFDKDSYESGDNVEIKIHTKNNISTISKMRVSIANPKGDIVEKDIDVYCDENGIGNYIYKLDEYAIEGFWSIDSIYVEDSQGNSTTYQNTHNKDWKFYVKLVDRKAPTIKKIEFDKESYKAGEEVKIQICAEDDLSGTDSMVINTVNPKGESVDCIIGISFDENGVANYSYILSEYVQGGTWNVESISLQDKAGNSEHYTSGVHFDGTFKVEPNDKEDVKAPTIKEIKFDKESYEAGEEVKIQICAEDDLSGADSMVINTVNPKGESVDCIIGISFDENGVANYSYILSEYVQGGTWNVESISLQDKAGNSEHYTSGVHFDGTFKVEPNDNEDTKAPLIKKIRFDKKDYKAGEEVKIQVYTEDNLSGTKNMTITIVNSKGEITNQTLGVQFDEKGVAEFLYELDKYSMIGTWKVASISLQDKAGNSEYYTSGVDFDGSFEVINEPPKIIVENKIIKKGNRFNPTDGVRVIDNEDGDITNSLDVIRDNVNTSEYGEYEVEYEVKDSHDAMTTRVIKVKVDEESESLPPSIVETIKAGSNISIKGETYPNSLIEVYRINSNLYKSQYTKELVAKGKSESNGTFNLNLENGITLNKGDTLELTTSVVRDNISYNTYTNVINVEQLVPIIKVRDITIKVGSEVNLLDGLSIENASIDDLKIEILKADGATETSNKNIYKYNNPGKYKVIYKVVDGKTISTKSVEVNVEEKIKPPTSGGGSIVKPSVTEIKLVGESRYDTAIKVSNEGWTKSDNVVIVNSNSVVDALGATPFAKFKDAPILLTEKNKLNSETKKEIARLKSKNIYVIGGDGVVSNLVMNELKSMNLTVERISGNDRYETSLEVAKKLGDVSEIAVVNGVTGLPDAVSIAPVAASNKMPIVLVSPNEGTEMFDQYIKGKNIKTSYVIGKEAAISNEIANKLPNPQRLGGIDRNETNAVIVDKFYTSKSLNNIFVAKDGMSKADDLIDALAVGVLASKENSPVVIVGDDLNDKQESLLYKKQPKEITQVGGNGNEKAFNKLVNMYKK